jgi:hypothetical protein
MSPAAVDTRSKPGPVLVVMSTLAALQVMVAGSALTDVIGIKLAALLGLMVAAVQMGMQFYVRGQVTPWETVVAKRTDDGAVVAGPSAQAPTGVEVEEPTAVPDMPRPPDPDI